MLHRVEYSDRCYEGYKMKKKSYTGENKNIRRNISRGTQNYNYNDFITQSTGDNVKNKQYLRNVRISGWIGKETTGNPTGIEAMAFGVAAKTALPTTTTDKLILSLTQCSQHDRSHEVMKCGHAKTKTPSQSVVVRVYNEKRGRGYGRLPGP